MSLNDVPCNLEAERSILGGILLDSRCWEEAKENIEVEAFVLDSHRKIFNCMSVLATTDRPIDIVTLVEELERGDILASVGGIGYVSSLVDGVPDRPSILHYANIVKDKASLRTLISACNVAIAKAHGTGTAEEIVQDCQAAVMRICVDTGRPREIFIRASEFIGQQETPEDWLVKGIIDRGSNGFIVAEPKGSKSFFASALCDSLARGMNFIGREVPRRVRVGIVSVEDNPNTTRRRLSKLDRKSCGFVEELDGWLWIATRDQFSSFKVDRQSDLRDLIAGCKRHKIEFLVLDVLNVIHSADENDNSQMVRILDNIKTIQEKAGTQVCIVHHFNKTDSRSITQKMRGSSAISGFAEWIIGLELVDEDKRIRRAKFELKAGEPPLPVYYKIATDSDGAVNFEVVEGEEYADSKRKWAK